MVEDAPSDYEISIIEYYRLTGGRSPCRILQIHL